MAGRAFSHSCGFFLARRRTHIIQSRAGVGNPVRRPRDPNLLYWRTTRRQWSSADGVWRVRAGGALIWLDGLPFPFPRHDLASRVIPKAAGRPRPSPTPLSPQVVSSALAEVPRLPQAPTFAPLHLIPLLTDRSLAKVAEERELAVALSMRRGFPSGLRVPDATGQFLASVPRRSPAAPAAGVRSSGLSSSILVRLPSPPLVWPSPARRCLATAVASVAW